MDFYYEQAQDYPVDLYYLMDLSKSMEDDKEKLSALGDLLAATMQVILNAGCPFLLFTNEIFFSCLVARPNTALDV